MRHFTYIILITLFAAACSMQEEQQSSTELIELLDLAHGNLQKPELALRYVNEAVDLGESTENYTYLCEAFNLRGYLYLRQKESIKAIASFEAAISINTNDDKQLAYSYYQLGLAYSLLDDHRKAICFLKEANDIYQEVDDSANKLRSLNALSIAFLFEEQFEEAEKKAIETIAEAEVQTNRKYILAANSTLSRIYIEQGRLAEAEAVISKVEARFGSLDADTQLRFWLKKAYLAQQNGEQSEVTTLYEKATQLLTASKQIDPRLLYKTHFDYGQYLLTTGSTAAALAQWEAALRHPAAQAGTYDRTLSSIYASLALELHRQGKLEEAFNYSQKDVAINKAQRALIEEVNQRYAEAKYLIARQEKQLASASTQQQADAQLMVWLVIISVVLALSSLLAYRAYRRWKADATVFKAKAQDGEDTITDVLKQLYQLFLYAKAIGGDGVQLIKPELMQQLEERLGISTKKS